MTETYITRKTWHECIDDEKDFTLINLGAWELIKECVDLDDPQTIEPIMDFDIFCRHIIFKAALPDEFCYNDIVVILNDYLRRRWEEYNG